MKISNIEDVMNSLSETDELLDTLEMMKNHRIGDGELSAPLCVIVQSILAKFEKDTDPNNEKPFSELFWAYVNLEVWLQTRKGKKWAVKKFGKKAVRRIYKNDGLRFESDDDLVHFAANCVLDMKGLLDDDTQSLAA